MLVGKLFLANPPFTVLNCNDENLSKLFDHIIISTVNTGHYSTFNGKEGIHISYEFDNHDWDYDDLLAEIERIKRTKSKYPRNALLIWADRFELLYQDDEVSEILIKEFEDSIFENVFFLTFFNKVGAFLQSWKPYSIKITNTEI